MRLAQRNHSLLRRGRCRQTRQFLMLHHHRRVKSDKYVTHASFSIAYRFENKMPPSQE
jgi:hypothetical protein